jgi:thymidylate synthase (FAD)
MNEKIDVLNNGFVRLIDLMGTDLTPTNAARVSYDKRSEEMTEKDEGLLRFLAGAGHSSPFRHAMLQFEIYAPLMVARQWHKYVIGSSHQEPVGDNMNAWNESSRRYITEEPSFYIPGNGDWRKAPANSKQGSGELFSEEEGAINTYELIKLLDMAIPQYERALKRGVAPEQARLFLPAYGMNVRWIWTASLQSVAHFLNQRLAHDAQAEIAQFAQAVKDLAEPHFPVSLGELLKEAE